MLLALLSCREDCMHLHAAYFEAIGNFLTSLPYHVITIIFIIAEKLVLLTVKTKQNFNKILFLWLNNPVPVIYLLKIRAVTFSMLVEIRKQNYKFNSEF